MRSLVLLLMFLPPLLASCIGNNSPHRLGMHAETPIGDTVKELGANIMVIYQDMDGDHWFGSHETGLYRYDGERITHYPVQHNGTDITVYSVYNDNHGTLWLGTHEHGAYRFNGSSFERFTP